MSAQAPLRPLVLQVSLKTCVYWAFKFDTESITELIIICRHSVNYQPLKGK